MGQRGGEPRVFVNNPLSLYVLLGIRRVNYHVSTTLLMMKLHS